MFSNYLFLFLALTIIRFVKSDYCDENTVQCNSIDTFNTGTCQEINSGTDYECSCTVGGVVTSQRCANIDYCASNSVSCTSMDTFNSGTCSTTGVSSYQCQGCTHGNDPSANSACPNFNYCTANSISCTSLDTFNTGTCDPQSGTTYQCSCTDNSVPSANTRCGNANACQSVSCAAADNTNDGTCVTTGLSSWKCQSCTGGSTPSADFTTCPSTDYCISASISCISNDGYNQGTCTSVSSSSYKCETCEAGTDPANDEEKCPNYNICTEQSVDCTSNDGFNTGTCNPMNGQQFYCSGCTSGADPLRAQSKCDPIDYCATASIDCTSLDAQNSGTCSTTGLTSYQCTCSVNTPGGNARCPDVAGAVGDPQFTGFQGERFQVHGVSGNVYSLFSSPNIAVNTHFQFLSYTPHSISEIHSYVKKSSLTLPIEVQHTQFFTHPGCYMNSLGIKYRNTSIIIQSGTIYTGFSSIYIHEDSSSNADINIQRTSKRAIMNTTLLSSPYISTDKLLKIQFLNTHVVEITLPFISFHMINAHEFINLTNMKLLSLLSSSSSYHGLLGQTIHNTKYNRKKAFHIAGDAEDYVIDDNLLTGTKFLFSKF